MVTNEPLETSIESEWQIFISDLQTGQLLIVDV